MNQDIQREMLQDFRQLSDSEKISVLEMIKSFLKDKKKTPERITIEQYNNELEEAEAEFERGEIYTHEEVIARLNGWIDGK